MNKARESKKAKECSFIYCVWFRKNIPSEKAKYCIEITCTAHESSWTAMTSDLELAEIMIDNFPATAIGGLANGKNSFPVPDACILGKIPRL